MFKAICVAAVLGAASSLCVPAANAAVVDVVITGFLDTDVRNVMDTDNYWNGAFVGGAAFTASTASSRRGFTPCCCAVRASACTSLGKHEPP